MIRSILLDIEGTTTPIAFVHDVLFPYARSHVRQYLETHLNSSEVLASLVRLKAEHTVDLEENLDPPPLVSQPRVAAIDSMVAYVNWLIDRDRKSLGLKLLQGKIWEQGYLDGSLRAPVFEDVAPALKRWRHAGLSLNIFSSGSVLAQQLLFGHTEAGDLTQFIDNYFDTNTGPKGEMQSYQLIADALELPAPEILFISDVVTELDPARKAGMQTRLCIRPGNHRQPESSHQRIESFEVIFG